MLAALVRLPASLMFEPTSHDLPTPLPFLTPAPTLRFVALVFPCHVRWDLPSCSCVVMSTPMPSPWAAQVSASVSHAFGARAHFSLID